MKRLIAIAIILLIAPASVSAQEAGLVEKAPPFAARLEVTSLDSVAPEFSRDHLSKWSRAGRDPLITTRRLASTRGFHLQTRGQTVKKQSSRRRWPYLVSGGFLVGAGIPLAQMSWNGCRPRIYDGCSFHQGHGGLAVGIAALAGGGALLVYGATR